MVNIFPLTMPSAVDLAFDPIQGQIMAKFWKFGGPKVSMSKMWVKNHFFGKNMSVKGLTQSTNYT